MHSNVNDIMYIVVMNTAFKELFTQIFQHVKDLETHMSAMERTIPLRVITIFQISLTISDVFLSAVAVERLPEGLVTFIPG